MWVGDSIRTESRMTFRVGWRGGELEVFVDVPGGVHVDLDGAALLTAALLPAMALGESELVVDRPVDDSLVSRAERIQDILLAWDRSLRPTHAKYRRVAIHAVSGGSARDAADPRGTACYFTGGVDSFSSAVSNMYDLSALVYVHGLDVALDESTLYDQIAEHLRDAANSLGLPLLELRSNFRELGEASGVGWSDYHGAALSAIAHLLSPGFSRTLIPASWGYSHLIPWGSHPLLDPLWSSEAVEIVHDGAEKDRLGKIRVLADSAAAREHLRVCYRNYGHSYNCGECEKCVRTAVATQIAGVADKFPTLPDPAVSEVARVTLGEGTEAAWLDYLGDLKRRGARPDLCRAIETILLRRRIVAAFPRHKFGIRIAQFVWAVRYPREALARFRSKMR